MSKIIPARTLYLDGRQPLRVLRDGPALRIRRNQSADRLFPLQRLAQVVTSGPVHWSTDALLACAEMGVPVTFLGADGKLRARVLGPGTRNRLLDIDSVIKAYFARAKGAENYRRWVNVMAHQAALASARVVRLRDPGRDTPATIERLVNEKAALYAKAGDLRRFDRQWRGLLATHVDRLSRRSGVTPENACLGVQRIDIVSDFTRILIWPLQARKLHWLKRLYNRNRRSGGARLTLDWRHAVQFIEQHPDFIWDRHRETLHRFHAFLLEGVRRYAD